MIQLPAKFTAFNFSRSKNIYLPIIQNIEFVNKLINVVATFRYDTEISHQTKVITLLKNSYYTYKAGYYLKISVVGTYIIKVCFKLGIIHELAICVPKSRLLSTLHGYLFSSPLWTACTYSNTNFTLECNIFMALCCAVRCSATNELSP